MKPKHITDMITVKIPTADLRNITAYPTFGTEATQVPNIFFSFTTPGSFVSFASPFVTYPSSVTSITL